MNPDVFVGPYNPIVINTGSKLAVVDTGTGEAVYNSSKVGGQFLTNLKAPASTVRPSIRSSSRISR